MSLWDTVLASASAAAASAAKATGDATAVVATRAKLSADILVIDRDITARMEKFGVEMYAHLEGITSTQEFYVADDRLINIIRPTLIRAQREVAAYERKSAAMKGKVNLAEAERVGTASIIYAPSIGEKLMNAAKFAAAGAKEAANKTELAMLERQILGFKEEFGVNLYPIFASMEDNEGWLPTDRKVRSLYDGAREDIAKMELAKEEKREQIKRLDGGDTTDMGFAAPTDVKITPPTAIATPIPSHQMMGASTLPTLSTATSVTAVAPYPSATANDLNSFYGTTPATPAASYMGGSSNSGFGFMQNNTQQPVDEFARASDEILRREAAINSAMAQQSKTTTAPPRQQKQYPEIIDPFDSIPIPGATSSTTMPYSYSMGSGGNNAMSTPEWMPQAAPQVNAAAPDWFSSLDATGNTTQKNNNNFGGNQSSSGLHHRGGNQQSDQRNNRGGNQPSLNDADMNLFRY
jgi:hypothetical protein